MVRILGIETSCDETAIGIVEDGQRILANVVSSSHEFHRPYGGVVPEIACRVHVEVIWQVLEEALRDARLSLKDLDAVAVTYGPGLPGALLVGLAFAKGLCVSLDRPLVGVDHLAAHLYAGEMTDASLKAPYVGLVVSGGHTILCVVHPERRIEILGETKDDAVGEAFDKVAKLLGLGYPGGPVIDRLSEEGQASAVPFPRHATKNGFDFSFSGLKTAVYNHVKKLIKSSELRIESSELPTRNSQLPTQDFLDRQTIVNIAASFQEAAVDILVTKALKACQRTGVSRLVVGGGVASNRRLRQRLAESGVSRRLTVVFPPPPLCVDNGAMIAGLAYHQVRAGRVSDLALGVNPNLRLA